MTITLSNRAALLALVERFPRQRVLMLGDLVADASLYGEITRVSREAPVLILKEREKQIVPGGGANAANNLAALGAKVTPVGVVGDDESGDALLAYFRERQIVTRHIVRVQDYLTPTKTRILGGLSHWQRQQIVRVDREPSQPLGAQIRTRLTRTTASLLASATGLLVADYGYSATNAREVDTLRPPARRRGLPITIDSRYDLLDLQEADRRHAERTRTRSRLRRAHWKRCGAASCAGKKIPTSPGAPGAAGHPGTRWHGPVRTAPPAEADSHFRV